MEETHERRDCAGDRERCLCDRGQEETKEVETTEEEVAVCYVLMNSVRYGTEAWPCNSLEAAVQTLCRLARSAEQRRQTDGIQRYFCIKGSDLPAQEEGVERDPVSPILPDADALTLTLHPRETCDCQMSHFAHERDMREVVRLLCQEDEEADKQASPSTSLMAGRGKSSEVGS